MKFSLFPQKTMMLKKFTGMMAAGTLEMVVSSLVIMSDSVIAGRFLDSDAITAITLVTPIFSIAVFISCVISLGLPIIYAREIGKLDKDAADRIYGMGLILSVVSGVLLYVLAMTAGQYYLEAYGVSAVVCNMAKQYLFWYSLVMMLYPLGCLICAMILVDGDETASMISSIVQVVSNILLSILLVRNYGVAGIAFSSFAGTVLSGLACVPHFLSKRNSLKPKWYFSWRSLCEIVKYSIIDACSYLFLAVFMLIFNKLVIVRFGPEYLLLMTVLNFVREIEFAFDGVGAAVSPLVGVYIAERNKEGAQYIMGIARKAAVAEGIIVNILLFACAPLIPALYGFTDAVIIRYSVIGVRILSFSATSVCLIYLYTSYYLVKDKFKLGVFQCALRDFLLPAVFAAIGMFSFGITGFFAGASLGMLLCYPASMLAVYMKYGKEDFPLLLESDPEMPECITYRLPVSAESVSATSEKAGVMLKDRGYSERTAYVCSLAAEEVLVCVMNNNPEKEILAEITFSFGDSIRIIIRDDGKIFDLTDEKNNVGSLSAYVLSLLVNNKFSDSVYLTTTGCNRNVLEIKE